MNQNRKVTLFNVQSHDWYVHLVTLDCCGQTFSRLALVEWSQVAAIQERRENVALAELANKEREKEEKKGDPVDHGEWKAAIHTLEPDADHKVGFLRFQAPETYHTLVCVVLDVMDPWLDPFWKMSL